MKIEPLTDRLRGEGDSEWRLAQTFQYGEPGRVYHERIAGLLKEAAAALTADPSSGEQHDQR